MLVEHRFRAMNTDVGIWLWRTSPAADSLLHEMEQMFVDVEARLSRFQVDSELSRLNHQAGWGTVSVSPLLATVLAQALQAARRTDGIFDPTVLRALCQAGYDRSFESVADHFVVGNGKRDVSPAPVDWQQVRLDVAGGSVTLPPGLGIDLGGIAKGWTVDQVSQLAQAWGPVLVDAGGDIHAVGKPGGQAWPVAVQDPFDDGADLMTLGLADCAVATSSIGGRRWQREGKDAHHLIDPRTGQSGESDLHTVTVLAQTTTEAEVAAKTALILGSEQGAAFLRKENLNGLLIGRDGSQRIVGHLPQQSM